LATRPANDQEEEVAYNITGTQHITRSGKVYSLDNVQPSKGKKVEEQRAVKNVKGKTIEEDEFLQIMKRSKYDIIDQLKKTPARISILSLIMNSETHRNAIQKVLDEAYVQPNVTPEKVINMINVAKMVSSISFYEDEVATTAKK